jgi:hypothetical protein
MKKRAAVIWLVFAAAGFGLLMMSCRTTPKDTTNADWQYKNRYRSEHRLMEELEDRWRSLSHAADRPDYMARHSNDLAWDAEVLGALAPQMKTLAKEPYASNLTYLAYADNVEAGAKEARYAIQTGNWARARFYIGYIDHLGCSACHTDYRDR